VPKIERSESEEQPLTSPPSLHPSPLLPLPHQEAALKEREKDEEMEKRVREIERLEKERKLQTTIPMLGKIEAWEEARKQGAKEVLEIKPR